MFDCGFCSPFEGATSTRSFLHSSFLQAINAVIIWSAQIARPCPQFLCPAKLWVSCDVCSARQSTCLIRSSDSDMLGQYLLFLAGCVTSKQHTSASQGRIYSDTSSRCHSETEVADQTCYLTQSQCADLITPSAWQGSHCSTRF